MNATAVKTSRPRPAPPHRATASSVSMRSRKGLVVADFLDDRRAGNGIAHGPCRIPRLRTRLERDFQRGRERVRPQLLRNIRQVRKRRAESAQSLILVDALHALHAANGSDLRVQGVHLRGRRAVDQVDRNP
jgi:hypothetical protein